ncbi:LamG-like jellyroll fold domain-containing protein [Hymenobacter norwichensis]|uniref:LamG-like jellyroll fold domain-containing protein n=1 Tax=Hymenobacter norwichensis TaxID=223903 RepID=UPI0003B46AEA|nr:LamG-like jellyroll fold domain-containing protein [Hymenobacter norwichensis]
MKFKLLLVWLLLLSTVEAKTQNLLRQESFETDGENSRYTSTTYTTGLTGSTNQYFLRASNNTLSTPNPVVGFYPANGITGGALDGQFYWAGEGVRGPANNNLRSAGTVTLSPISVAGNSNLQVHVALYVGQRSNPSINWENDDKIEIQVQLDGGGWNTVGRFVGDNANPGTGGAMRQDLNLNGVSSDELGNNSVLTQTMTNFTFLVSGTGSSLAVRVVADQNGLSEEFAFDNIRVFGNPSGSAAPVLSNIEGTALNYAEGAPATQVTNTLTVTDADNTTLSGATVNILNFDATEDILLFTNQNGITGSFATATGTLTLTGTASLAAYQAALRSVRYQNTDAVNATDGIRTIRFSVTDASSTGSNVVARGIVVTSSLDAAAPLPYLDDLTNDGEGTRYRSNSFAGNNGAAFFRTNIPNTNANGPWYANGASVTNFTNISNGYYWYAAGTGNPVNPAPVNVGTFITKQVNTVGYTNVRFKILLGATLNAWDLSDYSKFYYRINGGSWVIFASFRGTQPVSTSSGSMSQDVDPTNLTNPPTGTALTPALTQFDFPLPATVNGQQVDFMLEILNDEATNNGETFVFDKIEVTGTQMMPPTVTTAATTSITTTSAVLGGNVTADGGVAVSSRGVVYSSSNSTPTVGGAGVMADANGSGLGSFSKTISGLTPGVVYYVRAYAVNPVGTSYGSVISFTTTPTAPVVTTPANGSITNDNTPTYSGTSLANSTITVYVRPNGGSFAPVGTTVASSSGTWSFTQPTALPTGSTAVYATAVVSGSAASAQSSTNTFTIDTVIPTATITRQIPAAIITNVTSLTFRVTFSESVSGVSASSFVLATTGTATGTIASVSPVSSTTFDVVVNSVSGNGTLGLNLKATASGVTDLAGNAPAGVTGPTYTIDQTPPTAVISSSAGPNNSTTTTTPIPFTVTFSENVTGFAASSVTISNGSLTPGSFTAVSGTTYTFTVTPTTPGVVTTVTIAVGVAQDNAGNNNTAAGPFLITYFPPSTSAPVVFTPANGSTINTATPVYTGTATIGSTVTVYVDGASIGTTSTDAAGNWSYTQPSPLLNGSYQVHATAQLSGQAMSVISNTNRFTVALAASYTSSTATQASTARVAAGSTNQVLLQVAVTIGGGTGSPLSAQSFSFTTNGSTAPADINAARLFFTGTSNTFATTTLFGGAITNPNGSFTITGNQQLTAGTNYFWLAYDVAPNAPNGNLLDATFTSLTVGSIARTPLVTNPAGSREIFRTDRVAGTALRFVGGNTAGAINFSADATNPAPILGPQYTQAVWLKPATGTGNTTYYVLGNGTGNTAAPYMFVTGNGRLGVGFGTGSGTVSQQTGPNTIAAGEWSHVAATYNGSALIAYLNGVAVINLPINSAVAATRVNFLGNVAVSGSNNFPGDIDEVSQWSRALSQTEVRLLRHLTLRGTESGLLSYLQFNDQGTTTTDVVRGTVGTLTGSTTRVSSTAPVSLGTSNAQTVVGTGTYGFSGTNVAINFSSTGGAPYEVVVSRLSGPPLGTQPSTAGLQRTFNQAYWIVNRYSSSDFTATVTYTLTPADISPADAATPANLKLFKRGSNSDTAFEPPISAVSASATNGTVTFPVTSFSQTVIGTLGSSPLPVELVSFTAQAQGPDALLRWITAQEKNSAYFEVESSTDGRMFRALHRVAGQGTSSARHQYEWVDKAVARYQAPLIYYRLRQVDLDGTVAYSPVQTVKREAAKPYLMLVPNPTHGLSKLTGATPGAQVQVLDAVGRLVVATSADTTGTAVLVLPMGQPTGVYIVRTGTQTLRLAVN